MWCHYQCLSLRANIEENWHTAQTNQIKTNFKHFWRSALSVHEFKTTTTAAAAAKMVLFCLDWVEKLVDVLCACSLSFTYTELIGLGFQSFKFRVHSYIQFMFIWIESYSIPSLHKNLTRCYIAWHWCNWKNKRVYLY